MTQYLRNDKITVTGGVHKGSHGTVRDERDGYYLVYMDDTDNGLTIVVSAWVHGAHMATRGASDGGRG